jgi:MFS family permease
LSGAFIMPASLALIKTYWDDAGRQRAVSLWSMGSWGGSGFAALLLAFAFFENRDAATVFGLPAQIAGPVLIALVLGVLLFSFRNWRCPACNKYLGRAIHPKFCQNCGVALHD